MHHTIPHNKLFNYPSLTEGEYEQLSLVKMLGYDVQVLVGKQDGFWVSGWKYKVVSSIRDALVANCACSRKFGEYNTRDAAIIGAIDTVIGGLSSFMLKGNAQNINVAPLITELKKQKDNIAGKQLQLFK